MANSKTKTTNQTKINQEEKKLSTKLESSRYRNDDYAKMSDGMVP
ncbi:hypothetical protein V6C27_01915 [Peptococcaceae bacterium 1198_IL3148]